MKYVSLIVASLIVLSTAAQKVIVLGFDGMSGMGAQRTHTPHMDSLKAHGAYTYKARAVVPTMSAPNWAAMISGMSPARTTVLSNGWTRAKIANRRFCGQPKGALFPTIFKVLRTQKPTATIACVHQWKGFAPLANTEAMDTIIHTKDEFATCAQACELIKNMKPDFLFVHFDHVDHTGHTIGHFTEAYYRSIEVADSLVGVVLQAVKEASLDKETYILITADHGGIFKGHGGLTKAEFQIPWILSGPKTKKNYEIKKKVKQYDTAATLAHIFNLQIPACWKGKSVADAFAE
ncbi:MAG: alkaline phosphatase [Chitinophagales bacterium]